MEPAQSIIQKLGGPGLVSKITGTAYTAPWRWRAARERGGTGGVIPQRHHLVLLQYAQRHGIDLSPADFLPSVSP